LAVLFTYFVIEVYAPGQESKRTCICVLEVSILSISTILLLNFLTVPTFWISSFFILLLAVFYYVLC